MPIGILYNDTPARADLYTMDMILTRLIWLSVYVYAYTPARMHSYQYRVIVARIACIRVLS